MKYHQTNPLTPPTPPPHAPVPAGPGPAGPWPGRARVPARAQTMGGWGGGGLRDFYVKIEYFLTQNGNQGGAGGAKPPLPGIYPPLFKALAHPLF